MSPVGSERAGAWCPPAAQGWHWDGAYTWACGLDRATGASDPWPDRRACRPALPMCCGCGHSAPRRASEHTMRGVRCGLRRHLLLHPAVAAGRPVPQGTEPGSAACISAGLRHPHPVRGEPPRASSPLTMAAGATRTTPVNRPFGTFKRHPPPVFLGGRQLDSATRSTDDLDTVFPPLRAPSRV